MSIFSSIGRAISGVASKVVGVAKTVAPIALGGVLGIPGVLGGIAKVAQGIGSSLGSAAARKEQAAEVLPAAVGGVSVAYAQAKESTAAQLQSEMPAALQAGAASPLALLLKNAGLVKGALVAGAVWAVAKLIGGGSRRRF